MILTREKILAEVQFEPELDAFQANPHSIDLRVSGWDDSVMPGQKVMLKSMEKITLPDDVMAVVFPRSSTNRRGFTVDMTGVVDAGYSGHLIIPITNTSKEVLKIRTGERLVSLIFHRLEEPAKTRPSKYHNGSGEYVPDKEDEVRLLEHGQLAELKRAHPLR